MDELGNLYVNVYDAGVGQPVEGAVVRILSEGEELLVEGLSDSFGAVFAPDIPAPPREYSEAGGPGQPFATYTVEVVAPEYGRRIMEGVQVYPSVTARQSMFLFRGGDIFGSVPPPRLWGNFPPKIPEELVKPLPPAKGFVVLPDPVIPAFVIVHEGIPSDRTAPNTWVGFTDYIKNVASSEIFPTWPPAAIRANVLAILSFTLNRIYTEWYRGKGFDFTITNSTAYDQAFSNNRTIYDEISIVVDELFTTYITKENIRQPLFAQYCDGRQVSCPGWLTQWGSKEQADRGRTAIEILRSAYGQDIFLMQAERVEGVPSSFPGTNLQTGSTGAAVRTIQEQINGISRNYPAIGRLRVDSIFGPATRESVIAFQRAFGLPETGIVDFGTWYKMSDIYVAVERLAELS